MTVLPRSLQGRLLALVLGAVTLTWLGAVALTTLDTRHELDELLDGHLAQAAAMLVVQQARVDHDRDDDDDDNDHAVDAPTLHKYAPKVAFQVWHEGQLSMRSSNAPQQPMDPPGKPFHTGFRTVDLDGKAWRVFTAYGAENHVQVYVGEQLDSRNAILMAVLRGLGLTLGLSLPLLALAAWWAVRSGTAPLRRLGPLLAQRRPDDLQPVDLPQPPSELEPLLAALNGLFARIATLLESERRFTADAAHELRTPIAAIRTQAQVALGEADEGLRTHALQATLAGCDRATRLVEQLLMLARLEADEGAGRSTLDLTALCRRVAAEVAAQALDKDQAFEVDAVPDARVQGNETLLGVLVRNLLDNAVRYSPRCAAVRLQLRRVDGLLVLRVEDGGPGLSAADRARLGERFFRVLGQDAPGSGLGWSIVRRIAAVHGAPLEVGVSADFGGLAVTLKLRAQPRAEDGSTVTAG